MTVAEIAKIAKVSRGTVDRVLHGRGRVNPETAARIRKIIEEVDYHPNSLGKAFALSQKKLKLGVLLYSKEPEFGQQLLEGIREAMQLAQQYNVEILLRVLEEDSAEYCLQLLEEFRQEGVSGIAMRGLAYREVEDAAAKLRSEGFRIVAFNSDMDEQARDCFVGQDQTKSGRCAAHLIHEICPGSGEILVLGVDPHHRASLERIFYFRETLPLLSPGLTLSETMFCDGSNSRSLDIVRQQLAAQPQPRGIFVSGAGLAGACHAVEEAGLADIVKVVGFDGTPTNLRCLENQTAQFLIDQNPFQQGYIPLKLLLDELFYGKPISPKEVNTGIVIRSKFNC